MALRSRRLGAPGSCRWRALESEQLRYKGGVKVVRSFTILFAVTLGLLLLTAPIAGAHGSVIRTNGWQVSWVGRWHISASNSIGAAQRALGTSVEFSQSSSSSCGSGSGSQLGLTLFFCDYWYSDWQGGGFTCSLSVSGQPGRQHWKTVKGLRVGDSLRRMRHLYPKARRHGSMSWWLSTRFSGLGSYHYAPAAVHVRHGKVTSLEFTSGCDS